MPHTTTSAKPKRTFGSGRLELAALGLALIALPLVAQTPAPPPVRTPFESVPASDPRKEIVQTVLSSPAHTTGLMTEAAWKAGDLNLAWQRATQFFPGRAHFTTARDQFLTHFFNPLGYQELEIFDSDYLRMCVGNRSTFTREGVVGAYGGMRESDPAGAASFSRKLGALEPYFRDEASKERLRNRLGGELFDHLLDSLRREGTHMFAGALLHEGSHARMDDAARVEAIQDEYEACKLPVQWDELRAYMTEIIYHARFYNWAVGDIQASWKKIESLLKQLEALRKKPKPLSEADKEKLEEIKAKIKAYIALIRLRMREIETSAQRMLGLMGSFRQEHIKPTAPAADQEMIKSIAAAVTNFVVAVGQEIQRQELLLKALEEYLDLWNRWAGCELKSPPERKIVDDLLKRAKGARWPSPPIAQAEELRKRGDKEIDKLGYRIGGATSGPAGRSAGGSAPGASGTGRSFTFSAFYLGTKPSLAALNDYIDYLNATWDGDLPAFGMEHGYGVGLGWRFSPALEAGLSFERTSAAVTGRLGATSYESTHSVNAYGIYLAVRSPQLLPAVRLVAQAGAFYADARYAETENDFVTAGRDGAFGWRAAAGPEVELSERLFVNLFGGYRQAALDGFGVSFFMPGNPPARLQFSGPTIQAGLSVRF